MTIESVISSTDVTAIAILDDLLFICSGNRLIIQNIQTFNTLLIKKIHIGYNIHGIKAFRYSDQNFISLYGNRFLSVFELLREDCTNLVKLVAIKLSFNLYSWILNIYIHKNTIVCVLANNAITVYDWKLDQCLRNIPCPISCILYSALILNVNDSDEILIASGTVFSQVIIWSQSKSSASVIKSLTGHSGVIFAINICPKLHILCSASDDRSIKIWRYSLELHASENDWQNSDFHLLHTLYGHESRIWDLLCLDCCLVSVGENGNICYWDYLEGTLISKSSGNSCNIWCLTSDGERIFFGSNCGKVKCKVILDEIVPINRKTITCYDSLPKSIKTFLSPNGIRLYSTFENGDIQMLMKQESQLVIEKQLNLGKTFHNYSTMDASENSIIVANKSGQLLQLNQSLDIISSISCQKKILVCLFLCPDIILTCGPDGFMKLWKNGRLYREHRLLSGKHLWPTAAIILNDVLIVGDRNGNLLLYQDELEPKQSFISVHGIHGVTDLKSRPKSKFVYSCGRFGRIYEYIFNHKQKVLRKLRLVCSKINFDWVGRLIFDESGKFLFVCGFSSTKFCVWSVKEQSCIWSLECGGGHRSWDFLYNEGILYFFYTKKNEIYGCSKTYPFFFKHLSDPILFGFHRDKINCCCLILQTLEKVFFVTSGEDNIILLNEFDLLKSTHKIVDILCGHISSIKCMSTIKINEKIYLVSGGGRSQLIIWSFEIGEEIYIEECGSHFLWNLDGPRRPWKNHSLINYPQVRYMCLELINIKNFLWIAIGCSDAMILIYKFDLINRKFDHVSSILSSNYCLLSSCSLDKYMITGSNDGVVRLWSMNYEAAKFEMILQNELHQSGINCITPYNLAEEWILFTCGDDTSLVMSKLNLKNEISLIICKKIDSAHTSLISGLIFLENKFLLSTSIDQRIKLWKIDLNEKEINLNESTISCISDISSIELLTLKDKIYVGVFGKGFEIFQLVID